MGKRKPPVNQGPVYVPPLALPFLYRKVDPETSLPIDKWIIKLAPFSYYPFDTGWMKDDNVGNRCLILASEGERGVYEFNNEYEAMQCMKSLWASVVITTK